MYCDPELVVNSPSITLRINVHSPCESQCQCPLYFLSSVSCCPTPACTGRSGKIDGRRDAIYPAGASDAPESWWRLRTKPAKLEAASRQWRDSCRGRIWRRNVVSERRKCKYRFQLQQKWERSLRRVDPGLTVCEAGDCFKTIIKLTINQELVPTLERLGFLRGDRDFIRNLWERMLEMTLLYR